MDPMQDALALEPAHVRKRTPRHLTWDERLVDELLITHDRNDQPGVAVGVMVNGETLYRRAFGLANCDLPVPLTPKTRMRLASVTKHFTALAWLLLCEDEKAQLDAPISFALPGLKGPSGHSTARQLLTHTSGLHDSHDILWSLGGSDHRLESDCFLDVYRHLTSCNFVPGSNWLYNNGGYLLISRAIENLSGLSLEEFLSRRIFEPLGMRDTVLKRWESEFLPNSAALHTYCPPAGFRKIYNGSELTGEGGLVSTVDDMLVWLRHMSKPTIGTAKTWATMLTPQLLEDGANTFYGLGLYIDQYRGLDTIHHAGGLLGGNSHLIKVPDANLDIVVLCNRSDISAAKIAYDIIDRIVPDLDPISNDISDKLSSGTFVSHSSGRVIQLSAENEEQFASVDGFRMPFSWYQESSFRPTGLFHYFKLSIDLVGARDYPHSVKLNEFGRVENFERCDEFDRTDWPPPGEYINADLGFTVRIRTTDRSQLSLQFPDRIVSFALRSLAPATWLATARMIIPSEVIVRLSNNCLYLSTARTRSLQFARAELPGE